MKGGLYLSDREWMIVAPLLPKARRRKDAVAGHLKTPEKCAEWHYLDFVFWRALAYAP
jgi:hypothetical protein